MSSLAHQLADRVEEGAVLISNFARELNDDEWRSIVRPDGRTVGVIVHHVGFMYPIEMDLVRRAVQGLPIMDVSWGTVAEINAKHAIDYANAAKADALELIARNSSVAADEIRHLTDTDLARAVPFSLNDGAPMTVQYIIEDHALKHPWHHLAGIRATVTQLASAR